ncbi:hypothetical protein GCM10010972_01780 [Cellulomonas carbonis]|uniref:Uncharacterized protein n=2 Tax=Cellulomonas carbonis TaxID=1386092 RepID=A0A0A0BT07_9CELL|nr:hypothetical protein N868_13790 [Cellulomonas carbonis T26]GGB92736.1 hypothetical protein GCM10010972_01780 [Cellulomonas carbonis]
MKTKDVVALLLVALIAVPYVGYLVRGEMPFVQDPRGMSAIGLVLGVAAFLTFRWGDQLDRLGWVEIALGVASFGLGVAALLLAETAAAEVWLAVFMASILLVVSIELLDHLGALPGAHRGATAHA